MKFATDRWTDFHLHLSVLSGVTVHNAFDFICHLVCSKDEPRATVIKHATWESQMNLDQSSRVCCLMVPFPLLPGLLGVDCSAAGDVWVCGRFHLRGGSQGICHEEPLDVSFVLRCVFCVSLRHRLLRKRSSQTPLEPGGFGKTSLDKKLGGKMKV